MKKKDLKNTDDILNSIETIQRAAAPDFFFTRLRARMENESSVPVARKRMLQPALILSGLALLLLINAMVLLKNSDHSTVITTPGRDNDNIQIVATAYHINDALPIELNQ